MIVADTNLIVYLFIAGDQTMLAQKVLVKDPYWIVPPLWRSEFENVLAAHIRRGMSLIEAKRIMEDAVETLENRQIVPSYGSVLELIAESDCTAYDCEFVSLAKQLSIQLVTADRQLWKEFPGCAISLEDFLK
ncbi:MAG TPA: type II toxin-antitoxin system VapC family toxin [Anaerolineales bacterium]|nr:type II toxin-antitoxin system VapC family toxin [Anaerolineales bacterium]